MNMTANTIVSVLSELLREGKIQQAIDLLAPWLDEHGSMGLAVLLTLIPRRALHQSILLLRDLIDGYPRQLIASPTLLCVHPDECYRGGHVFTQEPYPGTSDAFVLPGKRPHMVEPADGLTFLGWVSVSEISPNIGQEIAQAPEVRIPWGSISAAVGIFERDPLDDGPVPEVPSEWWGDLFRGLDCCAALASPVMLPYAEAVEYARRMWVSSKPRGWTIHEPPCYFLHYEDQARAHEDGLRFRRDCERNFPEHPSTTYR